MKMKRIMILVAILIFAGASASQAYFGTSVSWEEDQCTVCGKPLWVRREWSQYGYMSADAGDFSMSPGERATDLEVTVRPTACQGCRDKHFYEYRDLIQETSAAWLKKKAEEYKEIRAIHFEERRLEKISELQGKIAELEEKKNNLEKK